MLLSSQTCESRQAVAHEPAQRLVKSDVISTQSLVLAGQCITGQQIADVSAVWRHTLADETIHQVYTRAVTETWSRRTLVYIRLNVDLYMLSSHDCRGRVASDTFMGR